MAVKQVYMLESLEISHLRQIIWCFMNYQKFKRQILIAQYHILSETWFSYSSEILFYLQLWQKEWFQGNNSLIYSATGKKMEQETVKKKTQQNLPVLLGNNVKK